MSISNTPLALPSAPYGAFSEKGYQFAARLPAGREEETAFVLEVLGENGPQLSLVIPMTYPPVFGVDVGDSQMLEAVTEAVLGALPEGGDASTSDYDAAARAASPFGARRI